MLTKIHYTKNFKDSDFESRYFMSKYDVKVPHGLSNETLSKWVDTVYYAIASYFITHNKEANLFVGLEPLKSFTEENNVGYTCHILISHAEEPVFDNMNGMLRTVSERIKSVSYYECYGNEYTVLLDLFYSRFIDSRYLVLRENTLLGFLSEEDGFNYSESFTESTIVGIEEYLRRCYVPNVI